MHAHVQGAEAAGVVPEDLGEPDAAGVYCQHTATGTLYFRQAQPHPFAAPHWEWSIDKHLWIPTSYVSPSSRAQPAKLRAQPALFVNSRRLGAVSFSHNCQRLRYLGNSRLIAVAAANVQAWHSARVPRAANGTCGSNSNISSEAEPASASTNSGCSHSLDDVTHRIRALALFRCCRLTACGTAQRAAPAQQTRS